MVSCLARFRSFWIYPLIAIVLLRLARTVETHRSISEYALLIAIGVLGWTLIEYILHRFVFHARPSNPTLSRILSGFHRAHHSRPREPEWILSRLRTSLLLSGILLVLVYSASGSIGAAASIITGVWAGFLYYEGVHYRLHTCASTVGLEASRARHFRHHFVDDNRAFGVTSSLWDFVFGTRRQTRHEN